MPPEKTTCNATLGPVKLRLGSHICGSRPDSPVMTLLPSFQTCMDQTKRAPILKDALSTPASAHNYSVIARKEQDYPEKLLRFPQFAHKMLHGLVIDAYRYHSAEPATGRCFNLGKSPQSPCSVIVIFYIFLDLVSGLTRALLRKPSLLFDVLLQRQLRLRRVKIIKIRKRHAAKKRRPR